MATKQAVKSLTVANNKEDIDKAVAQLEGEGLTIVFNSLIGPDLRQVSGKDMKAAERPGLELTD